MNCASVPRHCWLDNMKDMLDHVFVPLNRKDFLLNQVQEKIGPRFTLKTAIKTVIK